LPVVTQLQTFVSLPPSQQEHESHTEKIGGATTLFKLSCEFLIPFQAPPRTQSNLHLLLPLPSHLQLPRWPLACPLLVAGQSRQLCSPPHPPRPSCQQQRDAGQHARLVQSHLAAASKAKGGQTVRHMILAKIKVRIYAGSHRRALRHIILACLQIRSFMLAVARRWSMSMACADY